MTNRTAIGRAFVRPFEDIPGPTSYPIVGTLLSYLPLVGRYRFDALHRNGQLKFREFGPVVREEIVPGTNVVWIYRPEDVREMFCREGRHPQRRSHLAVAHYRDTRPDVYATGGLLPTNGPDWQRLRSAFQRGLSSPRTVRRYLPAVNEIVDEFAEMIASDGIDHSADFLPYLSRFFLEALAVVAFDRRLDSFSREEMQPDSRCSRLMESAVTVNSCILKTDNGTQFWRHFPTPIYRRLRNAHRYLESVAIELIEEKRRGAKSAEGEASILDAYLSAPDLDVRDVIGMTADMLLAGIDTSTYSTGFALYHLARNPDKQERVHEEARQLLPHPRDQVNGQVLDGCRYLKAALKESFRLNPISVGVGRILAEDAVFSGYRVPRGTVVVTQNQVSSRFEEFFPQPELFLPERWLKKPEEAEGDGIGHEAAADPFIVLPFGHGPRTCIARRLAEQNIRVLLIKLCRRFVISWRGGDLDSRSELINRPDGPLLFAFSPRPNQFVRAQN